MSDTFAFLSDAKDDEERRSQLCAKVLANAQLVIVLTTRNNKVILLHARHGDLETSLRTKRAVKNGFLINTKAMAPRNLQR